MSRDTSERSTILDIGRNLLFNISKNSPVKKKNEQKFKQGRWTSEEHSLFISEILKSGIRNWKKVIIFI
jgi:hypothetical protein